ncbi:uncharacterized protein CLAFUR5_13858 [Fulvia fulva]|uniref:Uncharacterized protein n=1 Tax=Passalora fulva TaxID=5499 RepID=A0A9Q8UVR2_PASFU|nr:uncharacterized protein CLAFUR5_13858 [Fulvia fulva]UJO24175.1 hypothetical protein CLAFUR5_13858 [Fulvia fulva]WPV36987.1 hypothetical protein CLAFUW7_14029 [Fulvia fulva]
MSIFYCENEFITTINAYDSTALLKMAQCLQRLPTFEFRDFELKVYTETVFQSPSWKNLLTWMQRYHAHEVTGGIASPEDTLTDPNSDLHAIAVNSVFYVAESLRSLLWDQVEKIVTGMRPLLVKADARWGDD